MSSIEDRVRKIVVEQLGVKEDEVTPTASFVDDAMSLVIQHGPDPEPA